jgi:hypothetical protein
MRPLQIHDELARRLPAMSGAAIRLERVRHLRDSRGPVHGGAFLRERRIAFDCTRPEFPRIYVHELFHFVWLRLGNPRRREWEKALAAEFGRGARGELGWSAEWRKRALRPGDLASRTRSWRLYCCESFCDTAAWIYSGVSAHPEYTLANRFREGRRRWFVATIANGQLSI